jgi:hypothetical protein
MTKKAEGPPERSPSGGSSGWIGILIVTISGISAVATGASDKLGVPFWVTVCGFCLYPACAIALIVMCLRSTPNSPRHLMAYGLLKAILPWWPSLTDALRPTGPKAGERPRR